MTIGGTSRNQPAPTSTPTRNRFSTGLSLALGFLAVEWSVHLINAVVFAGGLSDYGIRPLDVDGLWGIITAPLLHGSLEHLMSNSLPGALFCFLIGLSGRKVWWEVTLITTVVAGLGTWFLGGAGTSHIGASGLVYGWLAYLVVRGIFNHSLLQIILGIILGFSYSGLIWGVLPVAEGISWQGHLFGALGGILAGMFISSDNPAKAGRK